PYLFYGGDARYGLRSEIRRHGLTGLVWKQFRHLDLRARPRDDGWSGTAVTAAPHGGLAVRPFAKRNEDRLELLHSLCNVSRTTLPLLRKLSTRSISRFMRKSPRPSSLVMFSSVVQSLVHSSRSKPGPSSTISKT